VRVPRQTPRNAVNNRQMRECDGLKRTIARKLHALRAPTEVAAYLLQPIIIAGNFRNFIFQQGLSQHSVIRDFSGR
jgi:hypothetical protein